jgi:hypothetical protein
LVRWERRVAALVSPLHHQPTRAYHDRCKCASCATHRSHVLAPQAVLQPPFGLRLDRESTVKVSALCTVGAFHAWSSVRVWTLGGIPSLVCTAQCSRGRVERTSTSACCLPSNELTRGVPVMIAFCVCACAGRNRRPPPARFVQDGIRPTALSPRLLLN